MGVDFLLEEIKLPCSSGLYVTMAKKAMVKSTAERRGEDSYTYHGHNQQHEG